MKMEQLSIKFKVLEVVLEKVTGKSDFLSE